MRRRLLKEESGFTLPEVLVAMMMMLIVMFALYSIFDMSLRVFSFGNDKTEAVENARVGLQRMEREIRAAYPKDRAAGDNTILFTGTDSDTIVFGNDLNGDRVIDTSAGSPEVITYDLNGGKVQRNSQDAVEYVSGLNFQYLDRFGNVVTFSNADIVQIKLDVRVQRGAQPGTQSLTTDVTLRNRRS
jgi:prepilin-type N-terminal cleavage/methylation domain-containing protein